MSSYRTGSDFLQALPMGSCLGTFCHLAAGFVGSAEPVRAGMKGPDLLSPCMCREKHVLGWQLLLGSFEQDRSLSVLSSVPYMEKEPVLTNWLFGTGQE